MVVSHEVHGKILFTTPVSCIFNGLVSYSTGGLPPCPTWLLMNYILYASSSSAGSSTFSHFPPWEEGGLPLPTIHSKILSLVIEYCKKHVHASSSLNPDEELMSWDKDFVKLEKDALFDLIQAANYLNIKGLLDLTCQTVADMIKGKTPAEVKEFFNIKNDFTLEEEEEVTRENQWASSESHALLL
ncbi:hypothetical protein MLD38_002148 [Melastoma candidum]|uniref:Uncharacterized protein n=1 Tax=Melastoma candidum TaxID=119954 RepID=A0ACB9SJI2_9MYRT|nr:hypothetical protein MLD38_002148 [Melastoma candidum]